MVRIIAEFLNALCAFFAAFFLAAAGTDNTPAAGDAEAALVFRVAGGITATLDLATMKKWISERSIRLFDIHYAVEKSYRVFSVCDVLQSGFGEKLTIGGDREAFFIASDGYKVSADLRKLCTEGDGYLAFADSRHPQWETLPRYNVKPGPFYLVWLKQGKTPDAGYPWPWQIAEIHLASVEQQYGAITPRDVETGSAVFSGYELFRGQCLGCHAIRGVGGAVGPDLGGILAYRDETIMRAFITAPSRFRPSKMPDFPNLTDADLSALIAYFRYLDHADQYR